MQASVSAIPPSVEFDSGLSLNDMLFWVFNVIKPTELEADRASAAANDVPFPIDDWWTVID
jgi:hypothetical protein